MFVTRTVTDEPIPGGPGGWAWRPRARIACGAVASLLALSVMALVVAPAVAAPGVPAPPTVVFHEDFENVPGAATNASQLISNYESASGTRYTADAGWLDTSNCNGIVANARTTSAQSCLTSTYTGWGAGLMQAMGIENGTADPPANYGLANITCCRGTTGTVQLETVGGVSTSQPLSGRFVTFGIRIAATTCSAPGAPRSDASLTISLVNDGTELPTGSGINPCTDPRGHVSTVRTVSGGAIRVGTYYAPGSTRVGTAGQLGFIVRNLQTGGNGNDIAFDDVVMLDATPALDKSFSPADLNLGQSSRMTFTITNTSDLAAKNGWSFTDTLPAGLAVADAPNAATTCGGSVPPSPFPGATSVSFAGDLAAGQASCTVSVDVTAASAGTYTNCAANVTVVGLNPPGCSSVRFRAADLVLDKDASPVPLVPGGRETFTLTVTNRGPDPAVNVRVDDQLPTGLTLDSASEGCTEAGGRVTCTLATLGANASHTFTLVTDVASSLDEAVCNAATAISDTPDPNSLNNDNSVCIPIEGRSDLSITKTPSTTTLPIGGGQVTYTLVVQNDGPTDATGVTVTDLLAAGLTLVAAEPSQGSCTTADNRVACDLGRLAAGGSAQVLVTTQASATPGEITNTATVRGDQVETDPDDNQDSATVSVPPGPPPPTPPAAFDLAVDKRASASRVLVGQRLTYRITVSNRGPAAAPAVTMTDTLNAPAAAVSVRTTVGACTRRIPITCELGTIAPGASVTITVVAKHREPGGRQRNAASASANGTESTPGDNLDSTDTRVRKIRLRLTKTASRATVPAGATLSYRIRVRNPTRGQARNLRLCDRLPAGLAYVSSKPKAKRSGRRRCWMINRLGPRRSRTFAVTVRAARGAHGRKTNRATVTSPDSRRAHARRTIRVRGLPTPVTG